MTPQCEPQGATAAGVDPESFPQAGVSVVFGASGGIGWALVENHPGPRVPSLRVRSFGITALLAHERLSKQFDDYQDQHRID